MVRVNDKVQNTSRELHWDLGHALGPVSVGMSYILSLGLLSPAAGNTQTKCYACVTR